ncbi:SWIM zinc finger family protein [Streptomyces sp. MBT97]|uniref:SWIM zinc finger family protein n=1 Tax=Streptomyces sp. MBT97 TaxID=2800411 RepID=UPI00190A866F|nr:SWIM zinc finger family protein [Streptomyces sp. MBT97]
MDGTEDDGTPVAPDTARETDTGPAAEARRALRAARERAQDPQPAQEPQPSAAPSPEPPQRRGDPAPAPAPVSSPVSRPADAARAALRRTASAPPTDTPPSPRPGSAQPAAVPEPGFVPEPGSVPETVATAGAGAPGDPLAGEPAGAAPADPAGAVADSVRASAQPGGTPLGDDPGSTPSGDTAADGARSEDAASADAGTRSPQAAPPSRPGDAAREALRAARAEARQEAEARQAAVGGRLRTGRRTAEDARHPRTDVRPAEVRRPDRTRDPVADGRARAVREMLAGAFRMPPEDPAEPDAVSGGGAVSQETGPDAVAGGTAPGAETVPAAPSGDRLPPEPAPEPSPAPRTDPPDALRGAPERAHSPRSMGAPARDGDHRRTFPAFPPRADGPFAGTWWGNAWVTALEEGALDLKRLARGRGYAERGNVDAITVTPGLVLAYVQGSRPRPYRVQVRLRTLGDADWERFLEAAVERPGHIAALLDKEMPESLADCGVPLLPGPGDLEPQCSCPDRGHPCKHAAALCYQTARLLDADPFVLLLLRGRGEREVLDALSRRNATRAARAAQEQDPEPLPGVRAAEALAARTLPPLPAPLPVPPHPEQPPAYPSAPDGPDSFALDHLATDAAARAHALLVTGHDEIGELDLWRDAVRLAASRPGSGLTVSTRALYAALAAAVGRAPSDLARAVAAWRQGGPEGLTVLEETWDPPAGRFDRARPLLLAADLPAFRPRRNHLTHPRGHVQLRFGQDGLWYAYESEPGQDDWWPRGTPDPDPVGALTGLGTADDL